MIGAGITHFVVPKVFELIVPRVLPLKRAIVYVSGIAEIGVGAGLLFPETQRYAAWGLIALLIAVFPANVSQAMRKIPYGNAPLWTTWARLPLQAVLIAWAYAYT
ncbi:MAG: DoxX family protein [Myxococcaceae bacterium]|nr:DoxX family protein [Myxococcaceae bacterium]